MLGDFKNSTKYAVSRGFEEESESLRFENGEYKSSSGFLEDFYKIPRICEEDFVVEVFVSDGVIYVDDLVWFDGESCDDWPWHKRYLTLKNEFDWSRPFYLSKHIVVTGREEFGEAVELFDMVPDGDGVFVKGYEGGLDADVFFVPSEAFEDEK